MNEKMRNLSYLWAVVRLFCMATFLLVYGCNRSPQVTEKAPAHSAEHAGEKHGKHAGEGQGEHEGEEHGHQEPAGLIHIDEAAQALIKLATEKVAVGDMPTVINAPATISADMNRSAKVGSKVKGRTIRVFVNPGDFVKAGQHLVLISSSEVGDARSNLIQAKARMELAHANLERQRKQESQVEILQAKSRMELAEKVLERQKRLYENKIAARKDVESAQAEYERAKAEYEFVKNINYQREVQVREAEFASARAEYEKAKQALLVMGVKPDEFHYEDSSHYLIYAPLSGTIVERKVNVGELVDENKDLFSIMDLSRVWIFADIYENLLSRVKLGQAVRLQVLPYPDQSFQGRISYISPVIDPHTRTIKIRADVENKSLLLKPEMFGEAQIITGMAKNVISIPKTAVLDEEGQRAVFVKVGDGFLKRVIEVGTKFGGRVEVLKGLSAEDQVVTSGAYQLKAQAMKGAGVAGTHAEHEGHEH
jgi:cobalt-zinc-cadmium efflux system membrane fusion protein